MVAITRSPSQGAPSEIASNGINHTTTVERSPTDSTSSTSSASPSSYLPPMEPTSSDNGMSKSSQLTVVAVSTVAFTGLLVYLSSVLYPLVMLAGAYVAMQQQQGDGSVWQALSMRIDNFRAAHINGKGAPTNTDPHGRSSTSTSASSSTSSPSSQASPPKRRSRVINTANKNASPSLRVMEVAVTSSGSPREFSTENSDELVDAIVEPNSLEPYEFENDFMKGKLLFLLQRSDMAPTPAKYIPLFDGKRRLFWVQLQVQFKNVPSGILYIGGEVPRTMNLGFFTGGLTKIILTVLQSLVRGLHCSFGQAYPAVVKSRDDEDLPHICFPLYTAVDQFVVTPPGSMLPVLGTADFGESKESMAARRKNGQPMYQYNTKDTYSFHFHSFFIDFAKWRLVGIPGMRDSDLRAFWDDMPLRLCAYSIKPRPGVDSNSEVEAKKAVHAWKNKEYQFCFQMSHKVQDEYEFVDDSSDGHPTGSNKQRRPSEWAAEQAVVLAQLAKYEFSVPVWFEYFSKSPAHAERRVGYAIRVRVRGASTRTSTEETQASRNDACDTDTEATEYESEYAVLVPAVAAFSPLAFIEHELLSTTTTQRRSHSSSVFSSSKTRTLEESISVKSRHSRYGKMDDERQFLEHHLQRLATTSSSAGKEGHPMANTNPEHWLQAQKALLELLQNKRTSTTTTTMTTPPGSSLGSEWPFLKTTCFVRKTSFGSSINIASENVPSGSSSPSSGSGPAVKDCSPLPAATQVVRVISSTCWRNEWVTLDKSQRVLHFFRMLASSSSFSIPLDTILVLDDHDPVGSTARRCCQGQDDLASAAADLIYWLRIVGIAKCHHIAFATLEDRQQWMQCVATEITTGNGSLESLMEQNIMTTCLRVEPEHFLVDTFSKSRGTKRFVLNDRCDFTFTSKCHDMNTSSTMEGPNEIVAQALTLALRLQRQRLDKHSTKGLLPFLELVGLLKWINLEKTLFRFKESERKVFHLNLYHLLLVHASILGFLPKSKTQWGKFFNGMSYNIGGIHLSIAEIEHGLIRAPMAPLKLVIAFLVIPKINDQDDRASLRLTESDWRLNFALNCLTKSSINEIMVFKVCDLDKQLDHVTSRTVEYLVSYDRESKIVYLPKVCDWYKADFVTAADPSIITSAGSGRWHQAILVLLRKYLVGSKAQLVDYLLLHEQALVAKWKFTKYDYRFHELIQEASLVD